MSTTIKLRFSPDARWRFARFILASSLLLASCYGMVALTALPVTTAISGIVLAALAAAIFLFIYNQLYKHHANIKKQSPMQAFVLTAFSLISALALFKNIGPITLTVAAISSASVAALSLAIYELAFKQKKVDAMLFKEMEKTRPASLLNNLSFLKESDRTKHEQSIARVTTLCQAGANPLYRYESLTYEGSRFFSDTVRTKRSALALAIEKHRPDAVEAMLEHSHALTITSGLLSKTYNAYLLHGEEVDGRVAPMTEQSTLSGRFAIIAPLLLETPKKKAMKILSTILNHPNYSDDLHPLIHAVNSESKKIVEATVTALRTTPGINVNATDAADDTALIIAANNGKAEIVGALLEAQGINVNATDAAGDTALIIAAKNGKAEVVGALLEAQGINVNATDAEDNTPLIIATRNRDIETVQALLAAPGIDVNATNTEGESALIIATRNRIMATRNRDFQIIRALLTAPGINVNATDAEGNTPLIIATKHGNARIVEVLLERQNININVNEKNTAGDTALIIATRHGNAQIVQALLEAENINVDETDAAGDTALIKATRNGNAQIVQALLAAENIDVDETDAAGDTALIIAYNNRLNYYSSQATYGNIFEALIHANPDAAIQQAYITSYNPENRSIVFAANINHHIAEEAAEEEERDRIAFLEAAFDPQGGGAWRQVSPSTVFCEQKRVFSADAVTMPSIQYTDKKRESLSDIPEDFFCNISGDIMQTPYLTSNGSTYDLAAIKKWLGMSDQDPLTKIKLTDKTLVPNRIAKQIIKAFIEKIEPIDMTGEQEEEEDERKVDGTAVSAAEKVCAGGGAGLANQTEKPLSFLLDDKTRKLMCCPLSGALMTDPLTTPSGYSYDRNALRKHLQENPTDPQTQQTLTIEDCRPNQLLKSLADMQRQLDAKQQHEHDLILGLVVRDPNTPTPTGLHTVVSRIVCSFTTTPQRLARYILPYTLPTLDLDKTATKIQSVMRRKLAVQKAQLERQPAFAPESALVPYTPRKTQPGTPQFYEEELTARR